MTTPPSDVLKYTLEDESWIAVRPSGTEPKIKFTLVSKETLLKMQQIKLLNLKLPLMKLQKFKR